MKNIFAFFFIFLSGVATAGESSFIKENIHGISYMCHKEKNYCIHEDRWILWEINNNLHWLIDLRSVDRNKTWVISNAVGKNKSFLTLYATDCKNAQIKIDQTFIYDHYFAKGKVIYSNLKESGWETPVPNSTLEELVTLICSSRK